MMIEELEVEKGRDMQGKEGCFLEESGKIAGKRNVWIREESRRKRSVRCNMCVCMCDLSIFTWIKSKFL